jgi:hypothetical protein
LNNKNGITLINSNSIIDENNGIGNTINNCNIGIKVLDCNFKKVDISADIEYNNIAIEVIGLNSTMNLMIQECHLTGKVGCTAGIIMSSVLPLSIDGTITNCEFSTTHGDGIVLNNIGNIYIFENVIELKGSSSQSTLHNGIIQKFSSHNDLYYNNIYHISAGLMDPPHTSRGLNIQFSEDNIICCTYIDHTNIGVLFDGDGDNNKLIGTYFLENEETSLQIEANTYISEQPAHANVFQLSSAPIEALHYGGGESVRRSRFYVDENIDEYFPNPLSTPNTQVDWFVKDPPGVSEFECFPCIKYFRLEGIVTDTSGPKITLTDLETVNPESEFEQFNEGRSWNSNIFLFGKLIKWPELLGTYTSIDSFYNVVDDSEMKNYFFARDDLSNLSQLSQNQSQEILEFNHILDSILNYSLYVDSMIMAGGEDSLEWVETRAELINDMISISNSYNVLTATIIFEKQNLGSDILTNIINLDSLTQTDYIEKKISQLYLKYFSDGIVLAPYKLEQDSTFSIYT